MKAEAKTTITVSFDKTKDKDEIRDVSNFIMKCKEESTKSGFVRMFDQRDVKIINKFISRLGIYEQFDDRQDDL